MAQWSSTAADWLSQPLGPCARPPTQMNPWHMCMSLCPGPLFLSLPQLWQKLPGYSLSIGSCYIYREATIDDRKDPHRNTLILQGKDLHVAFSPFWELIDPLDPVSRRWRLQSVPALGQWMLLPSGLVSLCTWGLARDTHCELKVGWTLMNTNAMKHILDIHHFYFQIFHWKKSLYANSSEDTSVI